jgi:hypothetical protein
VITWTGEKKDNVLQRLASILVDLAKANMKTDIRNALKKIPLQLKYLAEEHYKDM